ncbi:hypothetical protein UMZ34_21220 [Halopseudomonas pachastrellae]|nr:hypothetical protein UMZ34_21220 [Halopseudomonas pachastrellae]
MSQHDTLMRHLALLRMIPRHPHKRATTTLHERLIEEGFTLTPRSLQRDLERLSTRFSAHLRQFGKALSLVLRRQLRQ